MPSIAADIPLINPGPIDEQHIHVMAAIIWNPDNPRQFLIAQRPRGKHLEGYWEFPGGKLEPGETPQQGLTRELVEEIGIRTTSSAPYMQVYYRYPERNILLDVWVVEEFVGQVQAQERQALNWIDATQTDTYRFPPADEPILDAIRSSATAGTRRFP